MKYKIISIVFLVFLSFLLPISVSASGIYTCLADDKQLATIKKEYFGLHIGLESIPTEPSKRLELFQQIKASGISTVRIQLQWPVVEKPIGTFNWESFDAIYKDIEKAGLTASIILIRIPPGMWLDNKEILDPTQYFRWKNFVKMAVDRYSYNTGNIAKIAQFWEIWNEPELSYEGSPESLIELLNQGYETIKEADHQALVMAPATSTKGLNTIFREEQSTSPEYFNQIIKNGKFDVMNIHLYQKIDGINGSLDYVQKVRQELLAKGNDTNRQAKLAVTETSENHWTCAVFNSRTDQQQANLIINRYACLANAGVDYTYLYMAFDQKDDAENDCPDSDYLRTGIFNLDLTPRKSYFAVKTMIFYLTDYNVLLGNFNKTGAPGWVRSDLNKDGKVNIFDYSLLVENFNITVSDNPFGIFLGDSIKLPADEIDSAKEIGAKYYRWNVNLANFQSQQTAIKIKNNGLKLVLTVRNGGGSLTPSSPVTDFTLFKSMISKAIDDYFPAVIVYENEEDILQHRFFSGTNDQYLEGLKAVCEIAHQKGIKCANGGITSSASKILTASYYEKENIDPDKLKMMIDQVSNSGQFYFDLIKNNGKINGVPFFDSVIQNSKDLVTRYKDSGADYMNFHWYSTDSQALILTANYLKQLSGLPVITNEFAPSNMNNPDDQLQLMKTIRSLELPIAIQFSLSVVENDVLIDKLIINPDGTLNPHGVVYQKFIRQYYPN